MRTTTRPTHLRAAALGAAILLVAACGGSDEDGDEADTEASADDADTADEAEAADDVDELVEDATDQIDDLAEDLEEVQESVGGAGGATLTANGQTWEFDSALCAFGEDEIGQPGAVFNLSAIADGLQLYASIDDSGARHTLSINDIQDFENPSVSLSADSVTVEIFGGDGEFLTLDGKSVSGSVVMVDDTTAEPTSEPAEFSGTCP